MGQNAHRQLPPPAWGAEQFGGTNVPYENRQLFSLCMCVFLWSINSKTMLKNVDRNIPEPKNTNSNNVFPPKPQRCSITLTLEKQEMFWRNR